MMDFLNQQGGQQPSAPGPGNQADGLSQVQMIMEWAQRVLPLLTGTPAHQEVARIVERLSRLISKSGGGVPLGQMQTFIRDLGRQLGQSGLLMRLAGQQDQAPGGAPGAAQAAAGGAPMPTGAFPGA